MESSPTPYQVESSSFEKVHSQVHADPVQVVPQVDYFEVTSDYMSTHVVMKCEVKPLGLGPF